MAVISDKSLFKNIKCNYEDIDIESLGGTVRVSEVGGAIWGKILEEWRALRDAKGEDERFATILLKYTIIDSKNQRIFSDEDEEILSNLPVGVLNKLQAVAARLNHASSGADDAVKKD